MTTAQSSYPRVLVLAREPFNYVFGAGITMSNLFRGWPADRLASVYWLGLEPDRAVCQLSYRLDSEIRWRFPLNRLLPQEASPHPIQGEVGRRALSGPQPQSIGRQAWRWMNRKIGGMGLMRGTSLSERLKDWVTQFSPDIIYSVPTDLATIRLVASLVRATRAKLAVHIYDDWPATLGNGGILEPLYAQTTSPALDDLLELADARIAIGDDMALEYSRRYGHPFYPFQNCPEAEPWATARSERTCDHERGFIFRFFGAIYRNGNLQTLACFARAISLLSDQTKCRLEIHTSTGAIDEYLPLFNGSQGVSLHPVVANDVQMAQLYANADALVLAYDFDEHSRSRFRYSMATKLPTYLLSGTPIVIYAPPDLAVTRHAERTQTGYIIGEELPPVALADRLRQFADSRVLRAEIGLRARQLGLHRYCADTVRPRFWALLRDASAL